MDSLSVKRTRLEAWKTLPQGCPHHKEALGHADDEHQQIPQNKQHRRSSATMNRQSIRSEGGFPLRTEWSFM
jgi:hypothetical protein